MHWEWLYQSKKRNNLPKQGEIIVVQCTMCNSQGEIDEIEKPKETIQ